jgi:hypothetical protein
VTPNRRARSRGDGGAVIVEVAFVMPILLALVLGLMDFSLWELQESQVSSAARDGARAGVVLPLDDTSSYDAIDHAARAKIPDVDRLDDFAVQVWCSGAGGTQAVAWSGCSDAVPGTTRLIVRTSWTYRPLSFVGDTFAGSAITSTAEMVWNGPPGVAGSAAPPVCSVAFGSATVPPLDGASLSDDLVQSFTTNGHSSCTGFSAQLRAGSTSQGNGTVSLTGTDGTITFTPTQVPGLTAGPHTIRLVSGGRQWQATVTLADCTVSGVSIPTPPELEGTDLDEDLVVEFTPSGVCNRPGEARVIDADDPDEELTVSIPDLASATSVTFPADVSGSSSFWGPGTYRVAIDSAAHQLTFALP